MREADLVALVQTASSSLTLLSHDRHCALVSGTRSDATDERKISGIRQRILIIEDVIFAVLKADSIPITELYCPMAGHDECAFAFQWYMTTYTQSIDNQLACTSIAVMEGQFRYSVNNAALSNEL